MEFQINGQRYRVVKLGVFEQLKVSRKLLPVLAGLFSDFGAIRQLLPGAGAAGVSDIDALSPVLEKVLPRIADALSGLSDEDTNAIIHPCLAVVSRENGKAWTPVFTGGELMFDDIDMFIMLGLVARVVADSLGNFLRALPTTLTPDLPPA
jgi:hypothetical protein